MTEERPEPDRDELADRIARTGDPAGDDLELFEEDEPAEAGEGGDPGSGDAG